MPGTGFRGNKQEINGFLTAWPLLPCDFSPVGPSAQKALCPTEKESRGFSRRFLLEMQRRSLRRKMHGSLGSCVMACSGCGQPGDRGVGRQWCTAPPAPPPFPTPGKAPGPVAPLHDPLLLSCPPFPKAFLAPSPRSVHWPLHLAGRQRQSESPFLQNWGLDELSEVRWVSRQKTQPSQRIGSSFTCNK